MILDINKKGTINPEHILYSLLDQYIKSHDHKYRPSGLFNKRSKKENNALVCKLLKLMDYPESKDFVLTVIRHFKANHESLNPNDDFVILLSSFFSIYEIYQSELSLEIENKLMLRDIWNEMISQWFDTAIKSAQTARDNWRKFKSENQNQNYMACVYEKEIFKKQYPSDKKLRRISKLVNRAYHPWIPPESREPFLDLILDTQRTDRGSMDFFSLAALKKMLSNEEWGKAIKVLLSKLDSRDRENTNNKDANRNDILNALRYFQDGISLEDRYRILEPFKESILSSAAETNKYKEWLPLGKRIEMVELWILQTQDQNIDLREQAIKQLIAFKCDIPPEKINTVIEKAMICADDGENKCKRTRAHSFHLLCQLKNVIPVEKRDDIIKLLAKNVVEYNTFLPYEIYDVLSDLDAWMSGKDIAAFTNMLYERILILLAAVGKSKEYKRNIDTETTLLAICALKNHFSDEQLFSIVSTMKIAILNIEKSENKLDFCDFLYALVDVGETPFYLYNLVAKTFMHLIDITQDNYDLSSTITLMTAHLSAHLTDENRMQLIKKVLDNIHNDDIKNKIMCYECGSLLIKWMSENQKSIFLSFILSFIDAILTAWMNPESEYFLRSEKMQNAFNELIKHAVEVITDTQYANIVNQLVKIMKIWKPAQHVLIDLLNNTHNLKQKTALLCQLSTNACEEDNVEMKSIFIKVYFSYKNEIGKVLMCKAANQHLQTDLAEELSEKIMNYVWNR